MHQSGNPDKTYQMDSHHREHIFQGSNYKNALEIPTKQPHYSNNNTTWNPEKAINVL